MTTYLNSQKIEQLFNEIGQENLPALLDIFLAELSEYQQTLNDDSDALEQNLGNISHALKSSAASFGADNLCQVAKHIDAKVKAGERVSNRENRDSILNSIQGTIDAYGSLNTYPRA